MASVEFLTLRLPTHALIKQGSRKRHALKMLDSLAVAAGESGDRVTISDTYRGGAELLVLYGFGHPKCQAAVMQQRAMGGRFIAWDMGYFQDVSSTLRVAIDSDHPTIAMVDRTSENSDRFDQERISLRNDYDPDGPIVLVALGPKSRNSLGELSKDWEMRKYRELIARFPGRRIVYRPKPRRPAPALPVDTDDRSDIGDVLRGASLVVCRHSNVSLDATIAGIPFECEYGIAKWLAGREFTVENRLNLLHRAAWWQWREEEASAAWRFVKGMLSSDRQELISAA